MLVNSRIPRLTRNLEVHVFRLSSFGQKSKAAQELLSWTLETQLLFFKKAVHPRPSRQQQGHAPGHSVGFCQTEGELGAKLNTISAAWRPPQHFLPVLH